MLAGLEFEAPEVNSKDSDGWTPLSWAIERMNLEFTQWLLNKDAEMNYWYKIVSGLTVAGWICVKLMADGDIAILHYYRM